MAIPTLPPPSAKAVEIGEKGQRPVLQVRAIIELMAIYRYLGHAAKITELSEKALEIAKKLPPGPQKSINEADIYRELSFELLRAGNTQKAIEYVSYSLQVQESLLAQAKRGGAAPRHVVHRLQNTQISTLTRLGEAQLKAGNPAEAIKAYDRALANVQTAGGNNRSGAGLMVGLGQAYVAMRDYPRAIENFARALHTGKGNIAVAQAANAGLGYSFLQTNRPAKAIPYYKRAIEGVESIRSRLESEDLRSSFFEEKSGIYAGMISAALQTGDPEEAFNYNERARSRAFLDILGSKPQLARQSALIDEERALQERLAGLKAQLSNYEDVEADAESPDPGEEIEAVEKAYTDFLAKVRKENKEHASLMNVEPLTLREVQGLLEPDSTLLEYFILQRQVVVWIVERDRLQVVTAPIERKALLARVSALRDSAVEAGDKEKFAIASRGLYNLLLGPALRHVRGKELVIVPHDALHYLPFQALLSPDDRYLIQDYPIHYLSSASLMQFTHAKRRTTAERALVLGNPTLGDEAYNLRFAEREAREVASVYPKSAVYLRADASKPRAVTLSPNYDMLHFAVHAELNENDPMSSALLLAAEGKEDGRLKVEEIFSLDLKTSMVVLSACETGLGKLGSGDELVGLTRAFIYAGAPSVVTTLWKVNDRASYELMREFYQQLKTRKKSEALRQAQLKTMRDFPEPFYWAAYELTGEP